jgi:hypothetical protein
MFLSRKQMRVVPLTLRIVSKVDLLYSRIIMDVYTACHYNVPKKDGGICIVAKSVRQSERFFDNQYKSKPTGTIPKIQV